MERRVLIINHDPRVVELIRTALEDVGIATAGDTVSDEPVLHRQLRERPPDLVIFDIGYADDPDLAELNAVVSLLDDDIPVIVTTTHPITHDLTDRLPSQCIRLFTKPFDLDELVDSVAAAL